MKNPKFDKIREAIMSRHGGHEDTDDVGIMRIWNSLSEEDREAYLNVSNGNSTKRKEEKNNDNQDRSTGDV